MSHMFYARLDECRLAPAQVVGHSSGVNGVWGGSPTRPAAGAAGGWPAAGADFLAFFLKIEGFLI